MKTKVPVQKGDIKVESNSYKNMPFGAKVTERKEDMSKLRAGRDIKKMKK